MYLGKKKKSKTSVCFTHEKISIFFTFINQVLEIKYKRFPHKKIKYKNTWLIKKERGHSHITFFT